MRTPSEVPDVLAPSLRVVFVGINPGRVSAAARAHFANPRNDFWRLLHAAGFTSRLYEPAEQFDVLKDGIGITNAAYRTTPGSGDLRRGDFDGERLERLARELQPGWLGFVGKEAYRGAFGERPELGVQERGLGGTRLFVLPSTSPANAAVPWRLRLFWFRELAGRALREGMPLRENVRAVLLDEQERILLMRYDAPGDEYWVTPGGGREAGETDEQALRRELHEELGLADFEIGPLLWERESWFADDPDFCGSRSRVHLVRVHGFHPEVVTEAHEARWFSRDEVERLPTRPLDFARLLAQRIT